MNEVFDGFMDLRQGMNASRSPSLLAATQYAKGINVSVRGGLATTRPSLVLEDAELPQGLFQGAGVWSLESGDRIVAVIEGNVVTVDVDDLTVTDLGAAMAVDTQCYMTQVDRYFVIQDGSTTPVVLEEVAGVPTIRAAAHSIPAGYVMVFAHGRIHMVPQIVPSTTVDGRPYLLSGDILEPLDPTTVLNFTETEYLAEGGAHGMPLELGNIGGLGVYRNANTGTGVGQIMAFARNGVCSFDFSVPRSMWKSQVVSQVLFTGAGCKSPWSIVNANDDMIYRSLDGIRVLRYAISQSSGGQGALSNVPMSIEVDPYMAVDKDHLPFISGWLADNRCLMTAVGSIAGMFKAIVSWDLAAGYYQGAAGPGAYDGIWTGDDFLQGVTALRQDIKTGYVFADGPVLYRQDSEAVYDGSDTKIEARLETKAYGVGDVVTRKKLEYVEMWCSDIPMDTEIKVWYRPGGYPLWKLLGSKQIKVPSGGLYQDRRKVRISLDEYSDNCDSTSGEPLYTGTEFQFAIQWTGRMTIDRFRMAVVVAADSPPDPCDEDAGVALVPSSATGEVLNDYSYRIRGS